MSCIQKYEPRLLVVRTKEGPQIFAALKGSIYSCTCPSVGNRQFGQMGWLHVHGKACEDWQGAASGHTKQQSALHDRPEQRCSFYQLKPCRMQHCVS